MVQGRLEASDFAPNNVISDMSRIADRRMHESRNGFIVPLFYIGSPNGASACMDDGTARTRHAAPLTPSHGRIEFLLNRREVSLFPSAGCDQEVDNFFVFAPLSHAERCPPLACLGRVITYRSRPAFAQYIGGPPDCHD